MCYNPMFFVRCERRFAESKVLQMFRRRGFTPEYRSGGFFAGARWQAENVAEILTVHVMEFRQFTVDDLIEEVPCGKCVECRQMQAMQGTAKLLAEQATTPGDQSCFITLTYAPENIHYMRTLDPFIGSFPLRWRPCLYYSDVQAFNKRLREVAARKFGANRIRFHCAGEYGKQYQRPHYHLTVFGFRPPDAVLYTVNANGNKLYTSEILSSLWKLGHVVFGDVSDATIKYCANYVLDKIDQFDRAYNSACQDAGVDPLPAPFARASNRPGLGGDWMTAHAESIMLSGKLTVPTGDGGSFTVPAPRSFLRKQIASGGYATDDDDFIAHQRRKALYQKRVRASRSPATDLTPEAYLQVRKERSYRILARRRTRTPSGS